MNRGVVVYGGASLMGLLLSVAWPLSAGEFYELDAWFLLLFGTTALITLLAIPVPRVRPYLFMLAALPVSLVNFALFLGVFPTLHLLPNAILWFGVGFSFEDDLSTTRS
jgi:hypothetical protein